MRFRRFFPITALAVWAALPGGLLRADEATEADEAVLKEARVPSDDRSLLVFLRSRSLTDADRRRLERLLRDLGNAAFRVRERAGRALVAFGPPALPFLRQAVNDPDREVSRRAALCIGEIERGRGAALPAAAVRLLVERKAPGAVEALLAYLPFTDDAAVEEEVVGGLTRLTSSEGRVSAAVEAALQDPLPARRSAAAYVIGRFGGPGQRELARRLLRDPDAKVRLRAARGLIAGRDKSAVPTLIALLGEGVPAAVGWQAEESLFRIAGEKGPAVSFGPDPDSRKKAQDAWAGWWRDQGARVDLGRFEEADRQLGLTLIAELDTNKVWECGPDGRARWTIANVQGPIDAQMLPGGHRVLIAEHQARRVTERDLQGNVVWEKGVNQSPVSCQRLPNGNTFIATYNSVLEVTRDGKEVFNRNPGPGFFIYGAWKMRNGHIACISAQGQGSVIELDANGRTVRTVPVNTNNGWAGVEALPGDRFLVASTTANKVMEVDARGKVVWEAAVSSAAAATRLPNGHTLVACMDGRRVSEIDRQGKEVWHRATDGRPFHARRR